jgi:ABC-type multidrug transport system ATPase subunit
VEATAVPRRQDRSMSMIDVRDLRKTYGDRTVVHGITFAVQ